MSSKNASAMGVKDGVPIRTAQADFEYETVGVNSRDQLASLERVHQQSLANHLLDAWHCSAKHYPGSLMALISLCDLSAASFLST